MLTRKKNVLTRFREFFNSLEDQEQKELWDVLTALRGDDLEYCLPIKIFVTARIRGELFRVFHKDNMPFGAYIIPTFDRAKNGFSVPNLLRMKKLFTEASQHWRQHAVKAMRVVTKYNPRRARDLQKFVRWMRWE